MTGSIGGSGTVKIAPGAVLTATGALANPAAFLPGGHETLGLGAPGLDVSPISGFAATDSIDLIGKIATTFHFGGADVLTLANAGGAVAALHFAPGLTAADFSLLPDGHGGTFILHT